MKKEKLKKAAILTLVPSILLPSCSDYFFDGEIAQINEQRSTNTPDGAVAVKLKLNKEEERYLEFIGKLAKDIVDNPVVARQFAQSPEEFAKIYGVEDLHINFDDGLWKLILALGDDDIHEAIKNEDTALFLSLCDEKGLITGLQDSDLSRFHSIIDKNPDLVQTRSSLVVVLAAGVAVVGGAAAGVLAAAGAAGYLAAAIYDTVTFWDGSETRSAAQVMNNRAPQAYQVWVLKNNDKNTCVMLSKYQDKLVDELVEALQKHFPEKMENVDLNNLRQTIALNLPK